MIFIVYTQYLFCFQVEAVYLFSEGSASDGAQELLHRKVKFHTVLTFSYPYNLND